MTTYQVAPGDDVHWHYRGSFSTVSEAFAAKRAQDYIFAIEDATRGV